MVSRSRDTGSRSRGSASTYSGASASAGGSSVEKRLCTGSSSRSLPEMES